MEVGERGRLCTYRYVVTTRMIPALRWAAMRAILMLSDEQSHKTVSTDHNLFEEKGEPKPAVWNRGPFAHSPNALPLGQAGSHPTRVFCQDTAPDGVRPNDMFTAPTLWHCASQVLHVLHQSQRCHTVQ